MGVGAILAFLRLRSCLKLVMPLTYIFKLQEIQINALVDTSITGALVVIQTTGNSQRHSLVDYCLCPSAPVKPLNGWNLNIEGQRPSISN